MKIAVIHCGGTISCEEINGLLCPSASIEPHFSELERKLGKVSFTHIKLKPFLSELLNGEHINAITAAVSKALDGNFGGIIVTHGSDTVAYTSAALGYAFGNDCIPIVTVCADLPLSDERSSGHVNLIAAAAVIASGKARGVFSVYRENDSCATVHRGTRILRHRTYEAPLSSCGSVYGKVTIFQENSPSNSPVTADLEISPSFSETRDELPKIRGKLTKLSPVIYLTATPGQFFPALPTNCRAVILGSYHSGTADTESEELISFCKHCESNGVSVFIDGIGANADYESMSRYSSLGIRRLPPLTSPAAMYIKLWMLASNGEFAFTGAIERSLGGDIIPL